MPEVEKPKLCRDCKWLNSFTVKWMFEYPRCNRPDKYTGFVCGRHPTLCEQARYSGECGPEGKFFEPR